MHSTLRTFPGVSTVGAGLPRTGAVRSKGIEARDAGWDETRVCMMGLASVWKDPVLNGERCEAVMCDVSCEHSSGSGDFPR